MKHVDCENRLSEYVAGGLTAADEAEVREHLADCAECRSEHELIEHGAALASLIAPADAPDIVWRRIEKALDDTPAKGSVRRSIGEFAFVGGFAVLLAAIVGIALRAGNPAGQVGPVWNVSVTNGQAHFAKRTLAVGESLETTAGTRALVEVPRLGSVDVAPNSTLRLIRESADEKRLALDRGSLSARIFAPPRVFVVDTPSAVAVDLGCIYDLDVDDAGNTRLHVTGGIVVLESGGAESKVPAGSIAIARKNSGLGTPFAVGATEKFRMALERIDFGNGGGEVLAEVLREASRDDVLSLWHLLRRVPANDRGKVFDAIVARVQRPATVTREGVERLDAAMTEQLWDAVALYWFARAPVPPTSAAVP